MKYIIGLFATLFACFATGCSLFEDEPSAPETPPSSTLRAAPDTLSIDGQPLILDTYMWRDFQPVSPPEGKPLIAIFHIVTADSSETPEGLKATAAWVVHEDDIWSTYFTDEDPPPSERKPYQLYEVARNGPKFGPEVYVDAVVKLKETSGETHLLRAENQFIVKTE